MPIKQNTGKNLIMASSLLRQVCIFYSSMAKLSKHFRPAAHSAEQLSGVAAVKKNGADMKACPVCIFSESSARQGTMLAHQRE
jgi:hypothetical protein